MNEINKSAMSTRKETSQCNICGKCCSSISNRNTHMKLVHTEEAMKKYHCSLCNKKFFRECDLKVHLVCRHTKQPNIDFKCNICKSTFKTQNSLIKHKKKHTQKAFKCGYCEYCSDRTDSVKVHERLHTGEAPFKCNHCGKCFKQNTALVVHIRNHTGEKPYQCIICSDKFTQATHLVTHKKRKHSENIENNFPCKVCGKKYIKEDLASHFATHSTKMLFQCELCPKSFRLKKHLKSHNKSHSSVTMGPKCLKVFSSNRTSLSSHMNEAHNTMRIYKCELCDFSSPRNSTVKIHQGAFHKFVKFSCPRCSKRFAYKSYLTKHMKIIHKP